MRSEIKRSQSSPANNSRPASLTHDSPDCEQRVSNSIMSMEDSMGEMFASTDHLTRANGSCRVSPMIQPPLLLRATPKSQHKSAQHPLLAQTMHAADFRTHHSSAPNSSSKSWLNMSLNKFSQISLSATWAGHAFLSSKASPACVFEGDGVDVLRLSAEEVASQLTIIDLPIFQAIEESEFLSIGWNTSRKKTVAPNIVNFTRRFNQVSFWVIEEILLSTTNRKCSNGGDNHHRTSSSNNHNNNNNNLLMSSLANGFSPKSKWSSTSSSSSSSIEWDAKKRAEVIVCFIKVARKLSELNNLHSCYAIISALNSAPIYRLYKSWPYVNRKERSAFDRLTTLFNDDTNFENLRNHLSRTDLPCIPYLGMFLRDLVFVDIAHPAGSARVDCINHRDLKMGRILHSVMKYQKSFYNIDVIPALHDYLLSCRYIEELQKFLEDDNFKLSLMLEPPQESKSSDSQRQQQQQVQSNGKVKKSSSKFYIPSEDIQEEDVGAASGAQSRDVAGSEKPSDEPFVPSHRKSRSLGSNAILESITPTTKPAVNQSDGRKTSIQSSLENDPPRTRRLIDDSVMDETAHDCTDSAAAAHTPPRRSSVNFSIGGDRLVMRDRGSICSINHDQSETRHPDQVALIRIIENPVLGGKKGRKSSAPPADILYEGFVKRKTLLKEGKKPAFSVWVRYWLILRTPNVLQYYPARSVHGCSKDKFRSRSNKSVHLSRDCIAMPALNEANSFTLADAGRRNIYLFKANESEEADLWCQSLAALTQSVTAAADNGMAHNRSVTTSPALTFAI